jgi:hypothetical protein
MQGLSVNGYINADPCRCDGEGGPVFRWQRHINSWCSELAVEKGEGASAGMTMCEDGVQHHTTGP